MPYKKILIAVGESKTSRIALYESIPLAKRLSSQLCIVTVANEVSSRGYTASAHDIINYQRDIKERHQKILDEMKQMVLDDGFTAETILIEASTNLKSISENIIETVVKWGADLLIVGTHNRRGTRRFLLGSTAEETLRNSPIPVLLVPSNEPD